MGDPLADPSLKGDLIADSPLPCLASPGETLLPALILLPALSGAGGRGGGEVLVEMTGESSACFRSDISRSDGCVFCGRGGGFRSL